jgi:hypothetical protein
LPDVKSIYMKAESKQDLEELIHQLEIQKADLKARLPAHSIPSSMIAALDDLEEQINEAKARLSAFTN